MTAANSWGARFASAGIAPMTVYEHIMVPRMFEPWGNVLLDELAVAPGEAVLDVATGPGTVARLAASRVGPRGRVVGCDFSPAMLAIARGKPPMPGAAPVSYVECPADALDVRDDSVDVVTCQHGLQFFPDRPAALAEMHRAVRDGGRVGVAVWGPIQQTPPYDALAEGIAAVLGEVA
ncbi:MAG TPA: class I SAM-dependent methyltransferase, partial [Jatrophihabitantaceae bacterium]|nr:class I SAM-dependent methyltransferase [Jatrophihabitantaceae bacterium]